MNTKSKTKARNENRDIVCDICDFVWRVKMFLGHNYRYIIMDYFEH